MNSRTCANCGSLEIQLTNSQGGTTSGPFTETYECAGCGATGRIQGEAGESPQSWTRTGQLYQGGL